MEAAGLLHINVQRKYYGVDEALGMGLYGKSHRGVLFPCCTGNNVASYWEALGPLFAFSGGVLVGPRGAEGFRLCLALHVLPAKPSVWCCKAVCQRNTVPILQKTKLIEAFGRLQQKCQ